MSSPRFTRSPIWTLTDRITPAAGAARMAEPPGLGTSRPVSASDSTSESRETSAMPTGTRVC